MKVSLIIVFCFLSSAIFSQNIAGKWRGEFTIQDSIQVPFNFEIDKNLNVLLINGAEKLNAGKARIVKDSVIIPLNQFDNVLLLKRNNLSLTGILKRQGGDTFARLKAEKGKLYRFKEKGIKPRANYSGKYEVAFIDTKGNESTAIGLFTQKGNKLIATFMSASGDTRFQEGIVEGNKFYLSSFFGSTPGYYTGEFSSAKAFTGNQFGIKAKIRLKGKLNPNAALPDAYAITQAKDSVFSFSLPDVNGNSVRLSDNKFRNKPVIITLTGTWCPNCMDETKFLTEWYEKNKERGIEIMAIHFERQKDTVFARKVMTRYKERYKIAYTQLFGGTTSKEDIANALPQLQNFKAFPTMIFIDRNGRVHKIHSGFSGPATGKYYEEFIKEFNKEADTLLEK